MGNRITIMDVARKAGVSKGAVSLALNNSPEISKATAERIQAIARELDYKPIHRQAKKNRQNWCFLLPYTFRSYSYTELDLMTMEILEEYAQQYNASLRISRLSENGGLPESLSAADIDVFFIKSHFQEILDQCAALKHTRNIILFGFENNVSSGIQVQSNTHSAMQMLFNAIKESSCDEIIMIDVEKNTHSSSFQQEAISYLRYLALSNGNIPCRLLSETRETAAEKLASEIRRTRGKVAAVGFRKSIYEKSVLKNLAVCGLTPGKDYECFAAEYNPSAMNIPGFYYLDLRGPELIRQGVLAAAGNAPETNYQIMLPPRIIKK